MVRKSRTGQVGSHPRWDPISTNDYWRGKVIVTIGEVKQGTYKESGKSSEGRIGDLKGYLWFG